MPGIFHLVTEAIFGVPQNWLRLHKSPKQALTSLAYYAAISIKALTGVIKSVG